MQILPSSQVITGEQRRVYLFRGVVGAGVGALGAASPAMGALNGTEIAQVWSLRGSNSCAPLCLVAQSHPTFCDPMGCSPPARLLEWVAIPFSRGYS